MKRPVYVYALCEPGTTQVRYVGVCYSMKNRLRQHLKPSNLTGNSHKENWIKSLLSHGTIPNMILLDIGDDGTWQGLETFHIAAHRAAGFDLTNSSDGGVGVRNPPKETRDKMRAAKVGRTLTEEHKQKIASSLKGRKQSPEEIEKRMASQRGVPCPARSWKRSPETKARMSAAAMGNQKGRANKGHKPAPMGPEAREATSRRMIGNQLAKGNKLSPETITKRTATLKANRERAKKRGLISEPD